jgi:lysine 2,3-aminomutase
VPLLEPKRLNDEMLDALKTTKALYVALHANHPSEFTEAGEAACAKLVNAGIPMISQTVLLKDINDNVETLAILMKTFVKNRIKPYYVHQGDMAKGTAHFRTTLEAGKALMTALRGHYSGLCQPTYVLDIPGGFGKVPICAEYIAKLKEHTYQVTDYQGMIHEYPPKI